MARTVFTLLALLLILAGCSYGEAAASGRDPYSILAGQWGWQGTDDCAAFPKKIHFSPNHDYMYLSLAPRKNDGTRKPRHEYTYKVLGEAALTAPMVTPVIAIPLVSFLPDAYASSGMVLITIPVTILLAILFGYLGMALVCLPLCGLLRLANQLRAIKLCFYTTILGTALWVLFWQWGDGVASDNLATYVIIGATCSFAVVASFCWLAGITIRPSGPRKASAA